MGTKILYSLCAVGAAIATPCVTVILNFVVTAEIVPIWVWFAGLFIGTAMMLPLWIHFALRFVAALRKSNAPMQVTATARKIRPDEIDPATGKFKPKD